MTNNLSLLKDDWKIKVESSKSKRPKPLEQKQTTNIKTCHCGSKKLTFHNDVSNIDNTMANLDMPLHAKETTFVNYHDYTTIIDSNNNLILTKYNVNQGQKFDTKTYCLRNDIRLDGNHECSVSNKQSFWVSPSISKDAKFTNNLIKTNEQNTMMSNLLNKLTNDYLEIWSANKNVTVTDGQIWDKDHDGLADKNNNGRATHLYFILLVTIFVF